MENKNISSKNVIVKKRGSLEALYYLGLFALAVIATVIMLVFAIKTNNKDRATYLYIIAPCFAVIMLLALRFYLATTNPIYTKGSFLYAKKFLYTRKISIADLDKITVATFDNDHKTSVKIAWGEKTLKYRFKSLDKESAAKLRKLAK